MNKHIPKILLLISPYLYIVFTVLMLKHEHFLTGDLLQLFVLIYLGLVVAVFIPNMIYAFMLAKDGESSNRLLFWDMMLKLCNIPIYIAVFLLGFIITMMPLGFIMTIIFVIFDYLLLLPSSMYGVSGLIQARREKKITTAAAVVNGILHFCFCADVISAIVMYCKVKVIDKKQTY